MRAFYGPRNPQPSRARDACGIRLAILEASAARRLTVTYRPDDRPGRSRARTASENSNRPVHLLDAPHHPEPARIPGAHLAPVAPA